MYICNVNNKLLQDNKTFHLNIYQLVVLSFNNYVVFIYLTTMCKGLV